MKPVSANSELVRGAPASWGCHGQRLGLGVLLVFTAKGICTTVAILFVLAGAADQSELELWPFVVVWSIAGMCGLRAIAKAARISG